MEKRLDIFFASMIEKPVVTLYGEPADTDAEYLQESLTEHYPFLANATFTDTEDDDGEVRTIVFSEKYGTKGL